MFNCTNVQMYHLQAIPVQECDSGASMGLIVFIRLNEVLVYSLSALSMIIVQMYHQSAGDSCARMRLWCNNRSYSFQSPVLTSVTQWGIGVELSSLSISNCTNVPYVCR